MEYQHKKMINVQREDRSVQSISGVRYVCGGLRYTFNRVFVAISFSIKFGVT